MVKKIIAAYPGVYTTLLYDHLYLLHPLNKQVWIHCTKSTIKHMLPAGGRAVSTPDYPEPLRSSLTDADGLSLQRDQWPRKNVPHPTQVPHVTSAIPEPLQNSMADAEYVNVRRPRQ